MSVINSSPPAMRPTPASNDRPVGIWAAMEEAARKSLGAFLLRQRWYSAKDAGTPAVIAEWLLPFQCPGLTAMVAVWKITPAGRPEMSLFIPLALVPKGSAPAAEVIATLTGEDGDQELVDAFSADAFVRAWVTLQLEGSASTAASKQLRAGATQRLPRLGSAPRGHSIRRVNLEQSNTPIRIGERAILKVSRPCADRRSDGGGGSDQRSGDFGRTSELAAALRDVGVVSVEPELSGVYPDFSRGASGARGSPMTNLCCRVPTSSARPKEIPLEYAVKDYRHRVTDA